MNRKLSIVLLIVTTLFSTLVKSQSKKSETSFIGEMNPSIQIARGNNSSEIIDFDQGVMVLFSEEMNIEAGKKQVAISLIDFKIKQFGKIGSAQKLYLPQNYDLEWHNRKTYNLLDFKYKVIDFGNYLIFREPLKTDFLTRFLNAKLQQVFINPNYILRPLLVRFI